MNARVWDRVGRRLGVGTMELAGLAAILLLAAADRLVNLPARGIWDVDQGTETWAIRTAVLSGRLPTFGSQAFSVGGTFHHGALFYDSMMPAAWLGNGNPTLLVLEIALFGLAVVPMVWWIARTIGGPSAGLAAALLAAVSPALIDYSTFVWNPVLVQPGTALACLGAWQAWRTHQPRWWVVAAFGTAVAFQSHLAAGVLILPMTAAFGLALRRGPAGERLRLFRWGLAGVALFLLTWLPLIVYELGHDFAETRAILAFSQPDAPAPALLGRLFLGATRIVAWPFTRWPLVDFNPGFGVAFAVAAFVGLGLVWRLAGAFGAQRPALAAAPVVRDDHAEGSAAASEDEWRRNERAGIRFVGGTLILIGAVLCLVLKEVALVQTVNEEQYHIVADVPVILAAGLVIGGLWRSTPLRGRPWTGRVAASLALAGVVAVCAVHWPPLTAYDGGWPAAQQAAARLELDAGGVPTALVSLPGFRSADAYGYPLSLDGVNLVAPSRADAVLILCDSAWYQGCGGAAEDGWLADNAGGRGLKFLDRFEPAPGRTLTVYRRSP